MRKSSYFPSCGRDQAPLSPLKTSMHPFHARRPKAPSNQYFNEDLSSVDPALSIDSNELYDCEVNESNRTDISIRQYVPVVFPESRMHLWDRNPLDRSATMCSATAMPTIMFRKRQCRDLLLALVKSQAAEEPDRLPVDLTFELTLRTRVDCLPKTPGVQSNHGLLLASIGGCDSSRSNGSGGNHSGDVVRVPMESVPSSSQLPGRHGFGTQAPENRSLLENLDKCVAHCERIALRSFLRVMATAKLTSTSIDERRRKLYATLRFQAHAPATIFALTPVNTVPTLKTALSIEVTSHDASLPLISPRNTGFLTMNKIRQAVLMVESDPELRAVPLVGVWIRIETPEAFRGASNLSKMSIVVDQMVRSHPLAWVACERYIASVFLREHVWVEKNTFLMMVFCGPIARCYEVSYQDSSSSRSLKFSNLCFDVDINAFEDASEYSAADDFVISCKFGRSYDSVIWRDSVHNDVAPSPPPLPQGLASRRVLTKDKTTQNQALLAAEQETPLPREAVALPPPSPGPAPIRASPSLDAPYAPPVFSSSRVEPSFEDVKPLDAKNVSIAKEIVEQNEILRAMVSNQQGEMERLRRQLCELQAFALSLASPVKQPRLEEASKSEEMESSSGVVDAPRELQSPTSAPIEVEVHGNLSSDSAHPLSDDEPIYEEKGEIYLMEAPSDFKFDLNDPKPSSKHSGKTSSGTAPYVAPITSRGIHSGSPSICGLGGVETARSAYMPALAPSRIQFSGSGAYREEDLEESEVAAA